MTKELRELLASLNAKKEQGRALLADNKIEEAKAVAAEAKAIQEKIEVLQEFEFENSVQTTNPLSSNPENTDESYAKVFFKALRGKTLDESEANLLQEHRALSSSTNEDGGYLIPEDVQTAINQYKRDETDLSQYVTVEPVSTIKGSRVMEKEADSTPFISFTEGQAVPDSDKPKFETINYAIEDLGGFLPIPNNLMNDADAKLKAFLIKWLQKKNKATRNAKILAQLATFPKKELRTINDIKTTLNTDLDPAIKAGAIFLTNQDGYNYLDNLEDADGKALLQPDPKVPGAMLFRGKRIAEVSNKVLKTVTTGTGETEVIKAPLIIGDLKEAAILFDRENISIAATSVGGEAFKFNRTDLRAIVRLDAKKFDAKAAVYGELVIKEPAV